MHRLLEKPLDAPLLSAPGPDVFVMPCSASQKRFWMLEQITPGDTAFVIPIAVQLNGPLNVEVLEHALNAIVQRHEILRTSFGLVDDEPKQIIATEAILKLHRLDLGPIPAPERRARIGQVMSQEAERPVALTEAPLLRATLVRLAPEEAVLMLTAHHIISDGWSNGILVREIGLFYHAILRGESPELPPLSIQYADYVLWQDEWLNSPGYAKQMAYWKEELEGEMAVLDFPTDFARRGEDVHEAILESRLLPAELTESLKRLCRETGTTLFMVFYTAYAVLLQRYTGQTRLMIGTTGANRNRPELEAMIGLFANILLLRSDVSPRLTFRDFLGLQRDHLLNSFANHEAPFERVMEQWQSGKRRLPKNLIQTHFLFQKAFMQPATFDGLTIQPLYSVSPGSSFELTFGIVERAEGVRLQMEYWISLFRGPTIQRFLAHFQALLEAAVANPETPLEDLPIFAENEHEQLELALAIPITESPAAPRVLDPAQIFDHLDRQIEKHFQTVDAPFMGGVELPAGVYLVALDERRELLPVGIPGPLYLGDRLGGFAGKPGTVPAPGNSGALLRTEFLGRHAEGGGIALWGRAEDVIPLPVFRFNRRIIDARLKLHPAVQEAIAVVHAPTAGEAKLIGYAVLKASTKATGEELRTFLLEKISDFFVPATILVVPALPKDAAGKVLTGELPLPAASGKKTASTYVPLQGMLQEQLLAIWREILKTPDVSIDDNFFELGGNSFLALRMMVEAGKLARRTLPLSLLLTGATVSNLARFIRESDSESAGSTLLPVQTAGARRPIYFLHGDWVGGGFYCNRLSQQLGHDQPFYALPPIRSTDEKLLTLPEMAARHRAAIREHSPHGPYLLGGYCIGSLVAMEMARQWQAEGETVEHLFLIDPPVWGDAWLSPAWACCDSWGKWKGWNLEKRIAFFDRYPVAFNRWLRRPLGCKLAPLQRALGLGKKNSCAVPGAVGAEDIDPGSEEEVLDGLEYSAYYLAYRLHRVKPLSVPATLFVPESTPQSRIARMIAATKMDPALCRVAMVSGNHTTCVTQDITAMTDEMRAILEAQTKASK